MVTVHKEAGLRFVIYTNDHAPPHVHVLGDGSAKITLEGEGGAPELVWAEGFGRGKLRKALRIVKERQQDMLQRWRDIHG